MTYFPICMSKTHLTVIITISHSSYVHIPDSCYVTTLLTPHAHVRTQAASPMFAHAYPGPPRLQMEATSADWVFRVLESSWLRLCSS